MATAQMKRVPQARGSLVAGGMPQVLDALERGLRSVEHEAFARWLAAGDEVPGA